jgi:hypothetical protein
MVVVANSLKYNDKNYDKNFSGSLYDEANKNYTFGNDTIQKPVSVRKFTGTGYDYLKFA